MNTTSKLVTAIASALLLGMYFFPLWQITLEAPQYPEGLGMNIYLHTVKGEQEADLNSINNLNHYIGMKRIEPDSIRELKFMPYIIGVMVALGFGVAFRGGKKLLLIWVLLFVILGIAGLCDFYLWEYQYGHDLDPRAIIKIPGMSYQPPLFGSQQMLNFTAYSYPGIGGILAALSVLAGMAAYVVETIRVRRAAKLVNNTDQQ
jgi:copper chaperone NosL